MRKNESHGMAGTRIYDIWYGMKYRCSSPVYSGYANYGGRGIRVCDEWENSFCEFYNWSLKNGYTDELSIDRIDNDGNYEPSNCRWTTMIEQARNKRKGSLNSLNTSGCVGVGKTNGKWRAYITAGDKKLFIGTYENKEDAIYARKQAELLYWNSNQSNTIRLTIPAGESTGDGYQLRFKGKIYWASDQNIISKAIVKLGRLEDKEQSE